MSPHLRFASREVRTPCVRLVPTAPVLPCTIEAHTMISDNDNATPSLLLPLTTRDRRKTRRHEDPNSQQGRRSLIVSLHLHPHPRTQHDCTQPSPQRRTVTLGNKNLGVTIAQKPTHLHRGRLPPHCIRMRHTTTAPISLLRPCDLVTVPIAPRASPPRDQGQPQPQPG
ncbi:hypothetical protein L226DRAFT_275591 [Lentinus tigrinus ALCF2SS1-7]|uniref:uncharacterized protein n=1 Tax=Lentinus tigrinus ALCF2SS1-7 TaxID=1328758 RepID=UPI001165FFD7|nr:hypothetical protein L226DRAFT_275591 [Lentinus tigrinus ALCF2SS1-7]